MKPHFLQALWKVPYAPTSYNFAWMQIHAHLAKELLQMRREITCLRMRGSHAQAIVYPHESPQYSWQLGGMLDMIDVDAERPFKECFQSLLVAVTDYRVYCDADRCYHVQHPVIIVSEDGVQWEGVGPRGLLVTEPLPWRYLEGFGNRIFRVTTTKELTCLNSLGS